jgi:hypothetical protein
MEVLEGRRWQDEAPLEGMGRLLLLVVVFDWLSWEQRVFYLVVICMATDGEDDVPEIDDFFRLDPLSNVFRELLGHRRQIGFVHNRSRLLGNSSRKYSVRSSGVAFSTAWASCSMASFSGTAVMVILSPVGCRGDLESLLRGKPSTVILPEPLLAR